jgi:alcohol dehydrogenase (cytochrome c)
MTAFRPKKSLTPVLAGVAAAVLECARVQAAQPQDATAVAPPAGLASPSYTSSQADSGKVLYGQQCIVCHGSNLDDGQLGPPLSGQEFSQKWGNHRLEELFDYISATMPSSAPGSLTPEQVAELLAYMMQRNRVEPSTKPVPTDIVALRNIVIATPAFYLGTLVNDVVLPPPPHPTASPLDRITPVTETMLDKPDADDWITWRRTPTDEGFSPLKQINKSNVDRLTMAWSWALPDGSNESTPIVHDGVMFVYGFGDVVDALNAATGDLLWEYRRRLPKGSQITSKKALAIYANHVFLATSDMHVVGLDVKTGNVQWDTPIVPAGVPGFRQVGGPLVAKGKVIVGTTGEAAGGNYIVALDTETGREAWRFHTIPKPDEEGGNSWNGLPYEKRTGGSVWNPGSYDPETGLVYFGPSGTYDTAPLRNPSKDPRYNFDAKWTNSTLALDPQSGRLAWHFEHFPNDQWDMDWSFERQIFNMPVNGTMRRVMVTGSKLGIFDVLDAKTGEYLYSIDLGYQTLVKSIDPKTGFKNINRETMSPGAETLRICPHLEGGKNWIPDAYSPSSNLMFVPIQESCMDLTPVAEGGLLSTGVQPRALPPPKSDGNYGQLQAFNIETKKLVWAHRQRALSTTGALDTAGGVVFAGYADRRFEAFDDSTGRELWHTRLTGVPNSNAITYSVAGEQYIAVIYGSGGPHSVLLMPLTPEIKNPMNNASGVTVFELPERSITERSGVDH